MRSRKPLLTGLALFIALAIPLSPARSQDSVPGQAAELVRAFMEKTQAVGMAVSIGVAGRIVWSEGFGLADLEQQVPVQPALTRFRIGSVAKPITATALALLHEQGKLDLDAPVQKYVPTFPEKRWPISTRQLAGHLAGIRHYRSGEMFSNKHYSTVRRGLAIFEHDSLLFEPGSKYSYSSYAWNLISAVVEGASGQDFLGYMKQHVFQPLGMNHTGPDQVFDIIPHRSRYYLVSSNGEVHNAPAVDNSYKWAGGGFLSTSEDLLRFGFAYLGEEFLAWETIELLWRSQETTSGRKTGYGIGWRSGDQDGFRRVGHSGGSVGGTTVFYVFPEQELVMAIIANMSNLRYRDLPKQIAQLFLPAYGSKPKKTP